MVAVYNIVVVEDRRYRKTQVETREHTEYSWLCPEDTQQDRVAVPQHDVLIAALNRVLAVFHDSLGREEQTAGVDLHEYLKDNNNRFVEYERVLSHSLEEQHTRGRDGFPVQMSHKGPQHSWEVAFPNMGAGRSRAGMNIGSVDTGELNSQNW